MRRSQPRTTPLFLELAAVVFAVLLASCGVSELSSPKSRTVTRPMNAEIALDCMATLANPTVSCRTASKTAQSGKAASGDVIGGQNVYVKLTSSAVSYDTATQIFSFDVTVQNLLNEALGSPNGVVVDSAGLKVFFSEGPVATAGTGTITVANADGVGSFTGANQPYFKYAGMLAHNEVSSAKTWQLNIPRTVNAFSFKVYVSATVQAMLVINEMLTNPGGTITDANGEWFEVYNAGTLPVDMQNYLLADSAASGRRPYNLIPSSLIIAPGGYLTFGETSNTTNNGGVPIDYVYGVGMTFANSLDALKISVVFDYGTGPDTVTIDRTQYSSAAVSAQNGISRELKNPALDNSNMDGSNWADADVTAVYGPGGRGTPKARNSTYTP